MAYKPGKPKIVSFLPAKINVSRVVHYLGIMYAVMCGALWVGSYCLWCIMGSDTCGAFWG